MSAGGGRLAKGPVKLFIGDIARLERDTRSKYVHRFLGMTFKNVLLHGVVTLNERKSALVTFEMSDPTGQVRVCVHTKLRYSVPAPALQKLTMEVQQAGARLRLQKKAGAAGALARMQQRVAQQLAPLGLQRGDFVRVLGDVFEDNTTGKRTVSAFHCHKSTAERDVFWIQELYLLYKTLYYPRKLIWDEEAEMKRQRDKTSGSSKDLPNNK